MVGGGGGANLAGVVYEVELTLALPRAETVGTAMNALAHCAEALYVRGRNDLGDAKALAGATLIASALPAVVERPRDVEARSRLLRGACDAGQALALAGYGLGHAMAQALGGTYGLPHGAMNALTLPAALRFNTPLAPAAVSRFGIAIGAEADPAAAVEALAGLGGFGGLRDFGVPEHDLAALAVAAERRGANQQNPRPATAGEIERLLHEIY
jgi:alcohol dehydrogenase class IV